MEAKNLIEKKFRPEIEGVRAVAALLVAVYHIWLEKVSGGVDVFFIVSGFLITTSLLSRYERSNKISIVDYYLNLVKRLFPLAFLVLFFVAAASYVWLPEIRWSATIDQLFASAFYYQNWQLATNSVDYLAQNNEASPVQHFWAMSLQGQFYLMWPIIIMIAIALHKWIKKYNFKNIIVGVFILLFIISFSYSIYITTVNQPWAYFNTFARMWEFSLGGLLALLIAKVNIQQWLADILGWAGLLMLVSTGLLLPVSTGFPGYMALYPTTGAIFIIVAGSSGGNFGVHRFLGSKPMVSLGGVSYAIYLWHWPILIFYYVLSGNNNVPYLHGLIIILVSILLSYLVTNIIEKPIRGLKITENRRKIALITITLMVPMLSLTTAWNLQVSKQEAQLKEIDIDDNHPGALVFTSAYSQVEESVDIIPNAVQARNDKPGSYEDECHQVQGESEVKRCDYGDTGNAKYTIAIVGGSHSAQWLPSFQKIAETESIQIINLTKSACRFSTDDNVEEDCQKWNEKVVDVLVELQPDLIFTMADVGSKQEVPQGYIEQFEKLNQHGLQVFALRDNGWFSEDPAACIEENSPNYEKCSVVQENFLPEKGAWEDLDDKPDNVYYQDFTEYYCQDGQCDVVIGNVLVYRDPHHITATYARTMAPILKEEIMKRLNN